MKKLIPLLLLLVMVTAGCDMTGLTVTTSAESPVISSFGTDPPTIAAGESSTLSWSVVGATTVSIDQGIGNVALSGRRAVVPGATTVYTLTATNSAGMSATATAQVIVSGAPSAPAASLPVVNSFTASPSIITAGSSTTLSWNVSNATSVAINPGVGTFASSGATIVSPAATTAYTLTATNAAGSTTATTQVTVSGAPSPFTGLPVVNYFTANPPIISAGGSTTLSWDVSGATSVTIDPGVGSVASVGTALVSPATSTNYTLTATNAMGWYSLTITVLVTGMPAAGMPDLVITDISRSGDVISYKIKNQGDVTAGPSTSRLSVEGVVKANDNVGSLSPGQEITRSFAGYSYACSGSSDSLVVEADVGGAVTESLEANNSLTVSWLCLIFVPPPIFIVEKTVTLYSVSAEDGHVRGDGATNPYPNVGDTSTNVAMQAFLSFDISGIPASATIKSASLDVSSGDMLGDPFGKLEWMRVYNHQYGTLGSEDFTPGFPTGAMYTYSSKPVTSFTPSTLVSALQTRVSAASPRFQVRLQFQSPTNGDGISDCLRLGSAVLVVTYE